LLPECGLAFAGRVCGVDHPHDEMEHDQEIQSDAEPSGASHWEVRKTLFDDEDDGSKVTLVT
jgi:hypothetical protein